MATPVSELLQQIVTLNLPDPPFNYSPKVTSFYPTQATHVDESCRLTVTLNERDGTFDYNEISKSSKWNAGFTDDDGVGLGGMMRWHSGKRIEKSWSFQFGGLNGSSTGGDDPEVSLDPVVYSFETGRIKHPLFGWLQYHGWSYRGHRQAVQPPMNQASRLASTSEYIYACSMFRSENCGHAAMPSCVTTE